MNTAEDFIGRQTRAETRGEAMARMTAAPPAQPPVGTQIVRAQAAMITALIRCGKWTASFGDRETKVYDDAGGWMATVIWRSTRGGVGTAHTMAMPDGAAYSPAAYEAWLTGVVAAARNVRQGQPAQLPRKVVSSFDPFDCQEAVWEMA